METNSKNIKISSGNIPEGIHVVAKPIGPACNLNCEYCFYLEKQALFGNSENCRMSDAVLSAYITHYITSQPTPEVDFVWQGGEPTLLGIDFFKRVVELQKPFAAKKTITNSLQTNGTLLTGAWCEFLKKHSFMVGISIDGPREIHNRYRVDRIGSGSFDKAMAGLRLLQKHGVEYNVMACVAKYTAGKPLDVYSFFKNEGVKFIQFSPIVERMPGSIDMQCGMRLSSPATLKSEEHNTAVTQWTVVPEEYGDFLIAIYEQWVHNDVGEIFVMNFEWALNTWIGNQSSVCIHAIQCGRSVVIEHNGDVYACDHCVYPQYKLGNILHDDLLSMVDNSIRSGFGAAKETALPCWCRECDVLAACRGGCPKHRFAQTIDGEPGLQYLCEGYRKFFLHIRRYLRVMAQLIEHGYPASLVMDAIKGPLAITVNY